MLRQGQAESSCHLGSTFKSISVNRAEQLPWLFVFFSFICVRLHCKMFINRAKEIRSQGKCSALVIKHCCRVNKGEKHYPSFKISQSGIPASQGCGGLHLRRRQRRGRHGGEHITHVRGTRTGKKEISE